MGLLDKTYKGSVSSLYQAIVDKYSRVINRSGYEVFSINFDGNKLDIRGINDGFWPGLNTSTLHDIYNDIGRDFTITTKRNIVITVDSNIDVLGHVKIKSGGYCEIRCSYPTKSGVELNNLNIESESLSIDLPKVKLTNVNIKVKDRISFTADQDGIELFKNVSGNIFADILFLRVSKSPLTDLLYKKLDCGVYSEDNIYERVISTNFIKLLEPDNFDINTYIISNWDFFRFCITKLDKDLREEYKYINKNWKFTTNGL
nr:MAG TPA: hypothetical protein [Caudoviricetes sp.]